MQSTQLTQHRNEVKQCEQACVGINELLSKIEHSILIERVSEMKNVNPIKSWALMYVHKTNLSFLYHPIRQTHKLKEKVRKSKNIIIHEIPKENMRTPTLLRNAIGEFLCIGHAKSECWRCFSLKVYNASCWRTSPPLFLSLSSTLNHIDSIVTHSPTQ